MGGLTGRRETAVAAARLKISREENCNYSRMLTSALCVVSKAFNGCLFGDNDLPGRYKCKDNHTQTSES